MRILKIEMTFDIIGIIRKTNIDTMLSKFAPPVQLKIGSIFFFAPIKSHHQHGPTCGCKHGHEHKNEHGHEHEHKDDHDDDDAEHGYKNEHGDMEPLLILGVSPAPAGKPHVRGQSWTVEEIRYEGRRIHRRKYDYRFVKLDQLTHGRDSKILVWCHECEKLFWISIHSHLTGKHSRCQSCAKCERWTAERVQREGPLAHPGNVYLYTAVKDEHITSGKDSKIPIWCTKCQDYFRPRIHDHFGISKSGCRKCAGQEPWTAERVQREGPLAHPGNIYLYTAVRPEHITAGSNSKIPVWCTKCREYFWPSIHHHLTTNKTGCPPCNKKGYSRAQIEWIEFCMKRDNVFIHHALNGGEYLIPGTLYHADGYSPQLKKIYEFHGDYWHGNLNVHDRDDVNDVNHKTMGELYDETMARDKVIREHPQGYVVEIMWEAEWNRLKAQGILNTVA